MHIACYFPLLGCLVYQVAAFYPYHIPTHSDRADSKQASVALSSGDDLRSVEPGALTFSLRNVNERRNNGFNIIPAVLPKQANSLGVLQDGTDFSYFCAMQFGSSSKTFYLLLDSAASNTWVMSSDCKTEACSSHNTIGASESNSLKTNPQAFSITYGTGSVAGSTASDTLRTSAFEIPFTFGLASTVSDDFAAYPMDGILGLGRADQVTDKTTNIQAPSLIDSLYTQKVISKKLFGLSLWRNADGSDNTGQINFGTPDASRYDGELDYNGAIMNTNGFWEIAIDDAGVDGKPAGLSGRTAIIDSGTSFILMPKDDAAKLHALIPGSAQNGETFTIPCDTRATLQLSFNRHNYNISYKDYVGSSMSGADCVSNIVGRQTFSATQWLVGDVFLKNVYTVFDFDSARVGFGVKSGASGSSAPSSTVPGTVSSTASSTKAPERSGTATATAVGFLPPDASGASTTAHAAGTGSPRPSQTGSAGAILPPSKSHPYLYLGLFSSLWLAALHISSVI